MGSDSFTIIPKISVVIPILNRQELGERALRSAFVQRVVQSEIIIIDDGSQPPFRIPDDLVGKGTIRLIRHAENRGAAAARNTGIAAANGKWIALLDSDDYWLPDTLSSRFEFAERNFEMKGDPLTATAAGFILENKSANTKETRIPLESNSPLDFASGCWFSPGSTILLRKEAFDLIGPYDANLHRLEDLDWFLRLGLAGGRLIVWNSIASVIEIGSDLQISELENAAKYLTSKYLASSSSHRLPRRLGRRLAAYLNVERASVFVRQWWWMHTAYYLARSILQVPRLSVHLKRFWIYEPVSSPPEPTHSAATQCEMIQLRNELPVVLFVISTLNIGGTELHLSRISRALVSRGFRVLVYSLSGSGPLQRELEEGGVTVIATTIERAPRRFSSGPVLAVAFSIMDLISIIIKRRPYVVHFFLPAAYLLGAPLAWLCRVPIRIMSRRSLNLYQRGHGVCAAIERKLHKTMTAILGNSQSIICQLREQEGVTDDRLGLIYNGIDLGPFECGNAREPTRTAFGLAPDTIAIVIVANLIPYKGHGDLLRALGIVDHSLLRDWRLLIVGRDDGIGHRLRRLASELQIDGKVLFLGPRNDIPEILFASDIGVLCSHEEGFSNAILEGMAAGLPMIVTNVGGNPEAVLDGQTGLIVPPADPPRLAEAILRLADDASLRAELGAAARRSVSSRFTFDRCIDCYEVLYRALLAGVAVSDIPQIRAG